MGLEKMMNKVWVYDAQNRRVARGNMEGEFVLAFKSDGKDD